MRLTHASRQPGDLSIDGTDLGPFDHRGCCGRALYRCQVVRLRLPSAPLCLATACGKSRDRPAVGAASGAISRTVRVTHAGGTPATGRVRVASVEPCPDAMSTYHE